MPRDQMGGGLRGWLSRLTSGPRADEQIPASAPAQEADEGPVVTSKSLGKLLSHVGSCPAPVLLDLGPFSGANVTYYGELLGCKVLVADLFTELDRHARAGRAADAAALLSGRFALDEACVDGAILWDLYDYLDRPAAHALARVLVRALRPDGVMLGFFGSSPQACIGGTRFVVEDDTHVRLRPQETVLERRGWLQNRDIIRMFDGLRVTDSYLLQNGWREMLFRKGGAGRPR